MRLNVFLKGMLMGICDLIPGISGGTIAFITGIYERLIKGVNRILSLSAIYSIFIYSFSFLVKPNKNNLNNIKSLYREYDIIFLFTLLLGIITALVLGASTVLFLLSDYFVLTMSFFLGLIIASSFIIYKNIDDHKIEDRLFGILGFLFGISLLFLVPANLEISLSYVFLSGFVGIGAMFLPGVSGSYLLYLLGSYEYMLEALKNPYESLSIILVFNLGAILGAIFISKFIVFILKNYRSKMLYILFGFVIGALGIIIRDILNVGFSYYGLIYFVIGLSIVIFISKKSKGFIR